MNYLCKQGELQKNTTTHGFGVQGCWHCVLIYLVLPLQHFLSLQNLVLFSKKVLCLETLKSQECEDVEQGGRKCIVIFMSNVESQEWNGSRRFKYGFSVKMKFC